MKNNEKLKELSNIIKYARKYSLIGEYGNSLEKYQEAISIIKERQKEIINESEDLKEKWKMTEYNIKSEMLQIKDILETCIQLHHSQFNYSKKQQEGKEFINENKKLMEKEIMDLYNKDKRIYEKNNINNNNNKNISYSNKSNKNKNKIGKSNIKLNLETKKNKTPKESPWSSNKNSFNNKYSKTQSNNDSDNSNIKKSKSLKVNPLDNSMFNPLEVFYGIKSENKKKNKELELNGKDNNSLNRKSEIIQPKLNLRKTTPFSIKAKQNLKNFANNKNAQVGISSNNNGKNDSNKKIKVVQIDLDDKEESKTLKKDNCEVQEKKEKEENFDMVEHALQNLSKLNIDNNDDSF